MANRWLTQFRHGFEKRMIDVYCQFAVGATGAPTLTAAKSKGIVSVVRNSAGRYTITLKDRYRDMFQSLHTIVLSSGSPAAIRMVVRSFAVTAATPTIVVEFLDSTGTAVEVTNGATALLKFEFKDSVV